MMGENSENVNQNEGVHPIGVKVKIKGTQNMLYRNNNIAAFFYCKWQQ
jgi:hypothetical protein